MIVSLKGQDFPVQDALTISGLGTAYIIEALPEDFRPGTAVTLDGVDHVVRGIESRPSGHPIPIGLLLKPVDPQVIEPETLAANLAETLQTLRAQHQLTGELEMALPLAMFERLALTRPAGIERPILPGRLAWPAQNAVLYADRAETAPKRPALLGKPRRFRSRSRRAAVRIRAQSFLIR